MKFIDITGKRFGKLTVIIEAERTNKYKRRWHCRCDCGKEIDVSQDKLIGNRTKSCGCYREQFRKIDITGERFGRLLVIMEAGHKGKQSLWLCKCDCGNNVLTDIYTLKKGKTKSCGCYQKDVIGGLKRTHNKSKTKLYKVWHSMKMRCYEPSLNNYHNYGGRGIIVCEQWLEDFMNFYKWAINNGYKNGLSIDRINVDGNYGPSNCRWVTNKAQNNNKRNNRLITAFGETHTASEWQDKTGIRAGTISRRLMSGWEPENALSIKPSHKNLRLFKK